ncbi:MAG: dihydroorotate dehydrogenase electron transfer subunit [Elusimicrobiota bacterium]|jgi:dihydroorotate dehydrogenase electron transfer subunit|nr:dihydroorotate dehydrogenase electron transfer subunit [Elusimicrobiota bacterium]
MNRKDEKYKIISNKELGNGYFELKLNAGKIAKFCQPGQFFMIDVEKNFLRRPLGICDVQVDVISFFYKVVGSGTKNLSNIKSGQIQALGPLGKGYPVEYPKNLQPLLIAGGTGIASIHFLAKTLKAKGNIYYGVRSKKDLFYLQSLKKFGWNIVVSTEDGSQGHKGFITEVLEKKIKNTDVLYVCGPTMMLKSILDITANKQTKVYASLEQKMSCGFGNCQGCVVKINNEIKSVCKDGPVFEIRNFSNYF